jgi:hypothetical protein
MGVESVEERVAKVEKSMRAAVKLLLLALLLLVTTVTLLVVRLVR